MGGGGVRWGWLRVLVSRTTVDHDASLSDTPKQMAGVCRKSCVRRERKIRASRTGCNDESICWRGKKFRDIVREIESCYVRRDIPKIAISESLCRRTLVKRETLRAERTGYREDTVRTRAQLRAREIRRTIIERFFIPPCPPLSPF